jgi:hypothetical protein
MADLSIRKGSTSQSITMRFLDTSAATFASSFDASADGLDLWYKREGEARVPFTAVDLASETADWVSGGLIFIDDGYVRIDVPDAALDFGADNVLVGGAGTNLMGIGQLIELTASSPSSPPSPTFIVGTEAVECNLLLPEAADSTHEGCPVVTKRRHIPMAKGVCGTAVWNMRLPNGNAANFADCIESDSDSASESESDSSIKVRFQGCDRNCVLAEADGDIVDATTGTIQFEVPSIVCQNSGIYQFQAALMSGDSPKFVDSGLISVEHGLWGSTTNMGGPPTIQEIRFALMDRETENDLLQSVEFDDADILEAIRWPVFQFNETPPNLGFQYNCNTFPFRYHWIQAITARLLLAAAHHYVRNKMQASSGGLTVDDKAKDLDYQRFAKLYLDEWKMFVDQKKIELNASQAYGGLYSRYSGYINGNTW